MKYIFSILFTIFVISCNAQTDSLFYLNKAMSKLETGDCELARKYYNVYKELYNNNKPVQSIEALLEDCTKDTFAVGETITKDGRKYIVAYTRDGGKHGFAVSNGGWGNIYDCSNSCYFIEEFVTRKGIPTLEELKKIYENRDIIRFYDIYWTCTIAEKDGRSGYSYTIDFSTGETSLTYAKKSNAVILLIYRF